MMITMEAQECDSFDQEDIDFIQAQLLNLQAPSLSHFQSFLQNQPMVSFASTDIVKSLLHQHDRDIKFVGCDIDAQFRIFFYILLLIGVQEHNSYPHLNTLIRQQFYKPNIFDGTKNDEIHESQVMLKKCLNYFEQLDENGGTQYILNQPLFQQACITMLKNSVDKQQTNSVYQQLASKFHIDMQVIKTENDSECFKLGANNHFYIIKEINYYFLVTIDFPQVFNQNQLEHESMRSEETGSQAEVEPSDNSTPQFKNSEVKHHKKSHKNSFGGDLQVVQYRDLLNMQSQRLHRLSISKNKVLSDYFDTNEVESCAEHIQEKQMKGNILNKGSFQDIIDNEKRTAIKGSVMEVAPQIISNLERRQNRRISFSEIIQYRDFNQALKTEQEYQTKMKCKEQQRSNLQANNLIMEDSSHIIRMKGSLIHNQQLQRIEQRHSSQRQSTHPDQQNSDSAYNLEIVDGETKSLAQIKDRKYSCLTQQMTSNKPKAQRQIQTKNYVFNVPKNIHKNSEVIIYSPREQVMMKQRYEENTIGFSQVDLPSHQSHLYQNRNKSHKKCLKLKSQIYSYDITNEPKGWFQKKIIYYFPNNTCQIIVINNTYSQKLSFKTNKISPNIIPDKKVSNSTYRNPFQELTYHSFENLNKFNGNYNKDNSLQKIEDKKLCKPLQMTILPKVIFNYLPQKNIQSIQTQKYRQTLVIRQPINYPQYNISNQYRPYQFAIKCQTQLIKRPQTFGGQVSSYWKDPLLPSRR